MKKALLLSMLVMITACGQKLKFAGGPEEKVLRCEPGQTTVTLKTKFLFLVDQSGSNLNGPYDHPGMPTDPQKSLRYNGINGFFQTHKSKSTLSWGFVSFNDTAARSTIMSSGSPSFSNAAAMTSALSSFQSSTDVGDTPYRAALRAAYSMIERDIALSGSDKYLYRVAFLTDGYPTDYCNDPLQTYCPGEVSETHVMADINSIVGLSPGGIKFSTVYYGFPDASASSRLQRMATAGGGQFVDASLSSQINLDDVIEVPVTCP